MEIITNLIFPDLFCFLFTYLTFISDYVRIVSITFISEFAMIA